MCECVCVCGMCERNLFVSLVSPSGFREDLVIGGGGGGAYSGPFYREGRMNVSCLEEGMCLLLSYILVASSRHCATKNWKQTLKKLKESNS